MQTQLLELNTLVNFRTLIGKKKKAKLASEDKRLTHTDCQMKSYRCQFQFLCTLELAQM
jgi:hypothetical protein